MTLSLLRSRAISLGLMFQGEARWDSGLGKAISYALVQWVSLAVYLRDCTIEVDNNLVENAIRPTVVGKRNWRFFVESQAGQRIAILYTIVANCRRRAWSPTPTCATC